MTRDVKHDSIITLGPKDSAFIVRENGKQEIYIPKASEDKPIAESEEAMLLIACMLDNKDMKEKVRNLAVAALEEAKNESVRKK